MIVFYYNRGSKFAGICLLDVTMNLLHGQGLSSRNCLICFYSELQIKFIDFHYSDEHGDRPRPLPPIPELKKATDLSERKESPSWDFDVSDIHTSFFFLLNIDLFPLCVVSSSD